GGARGAARLRAEDAAQVLGPGADKVRAQELVEPDAVQQRALPRADRGLCQFRLRPRAAPLQVARRRPDRRAAEGMELARHRVRLQPGGEARALHAGWAVVRRLPRLRIRRRVVRRARSAARYVALSAALASARSFPTPAFTSIKRKS